MSAAQKITDGAKDTIKDFIADLSDEEKRQVLQWSEKALVIRYNMELTKREKIAALSKLKNSEVVLLIFSKVLAAIKIKVWTNQSWARRLGFVGLASGVSLGGAAVGVATMGAGIGVPLILMTAAGGVVLGAAIDEIKKEL